MNPISGASGNQNAIQGTSPSSMGYAGGMNADAAKSAAPATGATAENATGAAKATGSGSGSSGIQWTSSMGYPGGMGDSSSMSAELVELMRDTDKTPEELMAALKQIMGSITTG